MLVKLTFHNMKKNEVNFALGKAKSAYSKNLLNENKITSRILEGFEKDLPGEIRGVWPCEKLW